MKLETYITDNGQTLAEFAGKAGVSIATVWRWRNGIKIPRRQEMVRIFEATGGSVRPDDFFDLPGCGGRTPPPKPPVGPRAARKTMRNGKQTTTKATRCTMNNVPKGGKHVMAKGRK